MTFNDDAQLDTSRIGTGGGGRGRGGMVIGGGGGILGVIALILYLLMGGNPDTTSQSQPAPQPQQTQGGGDLGRGGNALNPSRVGGAGQVNAGALATKCKTGADANRDDECRIIATENSLFDYWTKVYPASVKGNPPWQAPKTIVYSGQTQSACGTASNQVGPFYCPLDKSIYIDASFFQILQQRFGSSGGPLAQMYVVAHEYGHAVQDRLGVLDAAQQDPQGPASGGVRVELMADCLAGMWVKDASTTKDANGTTLLKPITQTQIKDALSAASAVGDDRIQKKTQGRVSPENFSHGTSEQRMRWFMNGYNSQNINSCNTLRAAQL